MSPELKRFLFGCIIILNTVMIAFNLFFRHDTNAATLNFLTSIICWCGIYITRYTQNLRSSEQTNKKNNRKSRKDKDD